MTDVDERPDGRPGYRLWINGLRVGVNAEDYVRDKGIPLDGAVMERASQIAARESARGRTKPRNTIKLEDVLAAEREVTGAAPPDDVEKQRREIARKRYGRR